MKKISPCLLLLAALIISACAGEVKGHVFLDKNNNDELDADEKGIGNALFEVDRDGLPYTSGMTDLNGKFSFKKTEGGDYWIKVVNTSDQYIKTAPQLTKESVAGKAAAKAETDTSTTTETTDTGSTTGEDAEKEEEKIEPAVPLKPLPGAKSLQNWIRLTSYSDGGTVNIPVGLDMVASIAHAPLQDVLVIAAKNDFELPFWYPIRCPPEPFQWPKGFTLVDSKDEELLNSSQMFNIASKEPVKSEAIIPNTLTEMAFVPIIVKLKAPDIIGSEATFTINLKAKCPDGNVVALNPISIKVMKERKLFVTQDTLQTKAEFDGMITLTTSVNNKGSFDFHDNAVLTITLPPGIQEITSVNGKNCSQFLSSQVNCNIDNIDKDGSFKVIVTFKLPSAKQYSTGYAENIKTELNFYDGSGEKENSIDIPDKPINIPATAPPPEAEDPPQ